MRSASCGRVDGPAGAGAQPSAPHELRIFSRTPHPFARSGAEYVAFCGVGAARGCRRAGRGCRGAAGAPAKRRVPPRDELRIFSRTPHPFARSGAEYVVICGVGAGCGCRGAGRGCRGAAGVPAKRRLPPRDELRIFSRTPHPFARSGAEYVAFCGVGAARGCRRAGRRYPRSGREADAGMRAGRGPAQPSARRKGAAARAPGSSASAASVAPTPGANLKPCPEKPAPTTTRPTRSSTNADVGVVV